MSEREEVVGVGWEGGKGVVVAEREGKKGRRSRVISGRAEVVGRSSVCVCVFGRALLVNGCIIMYAVLLLLLSLWL